MFKLDSRLLQIFYYVYKLKNVSAAADALGMSQPAVSHHLRILRQCDVIRFRKWGQRTVYYLSDNEIGDTIKRLLHVVIEEEKEKEDE